MCKSIFIVTAFHTNSDLPAKFLSKEWQIIPLSNIYIYIDELT